MQLDFIIVRVWNYQMFLPLYGSSHKVNDNIVVMLVTSYSGERSFSRAKTYLMGQSRLNHLTLLKHKELLGNNYGQNDYNTLTLFGSYSTQKALKALI